MTCDELGAVLLDMDGTVVDTEGLWWEACAEVAQGLGFALTPSDREALFGLPVEDAAAYLVGAGGLEDAGPREVEGMLTRAFTVRVEAGVTTLPGAVALLDSLGAAGVPAALVSASPRSIVDMVLETVGGFRLSIAAGDSPRNKPAPDPYLTAAGRLGVDPACCVAIEDSPAGVASARAAGCAVIVAGGAGAVPGDGVVPVPDGIVHVPSLESVDLALLRLLVSGRG
ncbi:HAD family hydrolase [Planotetraspora sp. GP83]|uniref:HAD family hydrolase n=1 Tax=Planotetraspora sp. GP83 TaxID=3156264 RepID=UPI0035162979